MIKYIGNCTNVSKENKDLFTEISNNSGRSLNYKTFTKTIKEEWLKKLFPDYDWEFKQGLQMKNDYYIDYFKKIYKKKTYFIVVHSSIEYVWLLE